MALITGRYQYRLEAGLDEPIGFNDLGLPPNLPTMPQQLQRKGYETILIGKWHLGSPPKYGPLKSGYDRFFGIYGGGTSYFHHDEKIEGVPEEVSRLIDQDEIVSVDGYVTEIFGDKAVEEIDNAPANKPFFMSLHFTAPHWPWIGPNDRDKRVSNMLNLDGGSIETYGEMVRSMDDQVGRVLDALERKGIADNTIVVFTSDNGGERFSDVWPLVGAKTELLEGGIRVPFVMRWPGKIPAGSVSEQTAMSMDFLPTFVAAAGGSPNRGFAPDGVNLLPVLEGKAPAFSRQLFWRYKALQQVAFRDGDWKYLQINGREYLFNLADDQRERANLISHEPGRLNEMKEQFAKWNADMLPYTVISSSYNNKSNGGWVDRY